MRLQHTDIVTEEYNTYADFEPSVLMLETKNYKWKIYYMKESQVFQLPNRKSTKSFHCRKTEKCNNGSHLWPSGKVKGQFRMHILMISFPERSNSKLLLYLLIGFTITWPIKVVESIHLHKHHKYEAWYYFISLGK